MHERQAVIFGGLIAGLAVTAFGAAAIYSGAVPAPLARGFSTDAPPKSSEVAAPCPAAGSLPVVYTSIQLTVLNGTTRSGLAGTAAAELTARGFTVASTGNYPTPVLQTARIMFGHDGLAAAYTVAAQFDKPVLALDAREGAGVDVAVGSLFTTLVATDKILLTPGAPLVGYAGCLPIDKITPAPEPTPDASDTSGATDAATPATG